MACDGFDFCDRSAESVGRSYERDEIFFQEPLQAAPGARQSRRGVQALAGRDRDGALCLRGAAATGLCPFRSEAQVGNRIGQLVTWSVIIDALDDDTGARVCVGVDCRDNHR